MTTPTTVHHDHHRPTRPARSPGRALVLAAAGVAVAVGLGVVLVGGPEPTSDAETAGRADPAPTSDAPSTYPAALVASAEGAPRLVVRAEGWAITSVDGLGPDRGEVRFGRDGAVFGGPTSPDGRDTLELTWRPVATGERYEDDPASFLPLADIDVAGRTARLFAAAGADTLTAQWLQGDTLVALRSDATTEDAYRAVVATIEEVDDVDGWLDAFPPSVVRPEGLDQAVAELRAGIPTPPGFDESTWADLEMADRTGLAVRVTGRLACGWIERFAAATDAGDEPALQEARDALAGTHDWPVLQEIFPESRFPLVLWRIADEIVATGVVGPRGGPELEGWANGLGCLD